MLRTVRAACLLLIAAPLSAQSFWRPQVGLQGGYEHRTATRSVGTVDFYDVPGPNSGSGELQPTALFAVVPIRERLALEVEFAAFQEVPVVATGSDVTVGLRADYALTHHVYLAAGGMLDHVNQLGNGFGDSSATALGAQLAAGYRVALGDRFTGRLEAGLLAVHKTAQTRPSSRYFLLFGLAAGAPEGRRTAPRADDGGWRLAIGTAAGYMRAKWQTQAAVSLLVVPASGTSGTSGLIWPTPPTLFAILPVSHRVAIEPGLDVHQVTTGRGACFTGQIRGRVDVAFGHWYAAPGVSLYGIRCLLNSAGFDGVVGGTVAGGYRFALPAGFGGRVEVEYAATRPRTQRMAVNSTSVMFGILAPLH